MRQPDPSLSREQIAVLEPFERIGLDRILLVSTAEENQRAFEELKSASALGFDTESKPTFTKGAISTGPHVVQFSTPERAYIFQLHRPESHPVVAHLIESSAITKVGFGLSSDRSQLVNKLGIRLREVLDLNLVFRQYGYRKSVGVRGAVAVIFQRRFLKSKSAATSNWANPRLSDGQIIYAANDAYAAIRVFNALDRLSVILPEEGTKPPPSHDPLVSTLL